MSSLGVVDKLGLRLFKRVVVLYYLAFLLLILPYVTSQWDPYEVVGVKHDASLEQIKKAYRELARKLHPDKSNLNEEESGRKFIELNKAFNILKDPEKRSRFDQFGETEDGRQNQNPSSSKHHRRGREGWMHNGYRTFTFYATSDSNFRRSSITTWQFHNEYLMASTTRPFFIFFYADFCPSCSVIERAWKNITDELAKFNIGSFTINVHQDSRLSRELGVSSIPYIACLLDGQIRPYHQPELSSTNIVRFVKSLLPNNLVVTLHTESEQDKFIALGPTQNRLNAIIVSNESNLKLRYLILAFELRRYYRFGHVSTRISDHQQLSKQYNLSSDAKSRLCHLLVFNEDITKPTIYKNLELNSNQFNDIRRQLLKWPFLQLPKIFSQDRFDDLCIYTIPKEGQKAKSRLCVILFASDSPSGNPMRKKFIEFIERNNLLQDERVVFAFIDPSKQDGFTQTLLSNTNYPTKQKQDYTSSKSVEGSVLLLERNIQNNLKSLYGWLRAKWIPENANDIDSAKLELHDLVTKYKLFKSILNEKVKLVPLEDEEGPSLLNRILSRMIDYSTRSFFYITSRESFLTCIILVVCALIASIVLLQSPPTQSRHDNSSYSTYTTDDTKHDRSYTSRNTNKSRHTQDDELKIMELKAETYNGMIRLLKPGYRSIVVLVDNETKAELLSQFRKTVWPYRRNKTLVFGYLCLDKNLNWYKALLQQVLQVNNLKLNSKKCIGTVLSLNGFKKYFRVYHAKHCEGPHQNHQDGENGTDSFLDFDGDTHEEDLESRVRESYQANHSREHDESVQVDQLLKWFPIWLDKMFDGLTKRYFLDEWPTNLI